jgi:hypothetical protein
LRRPRRLCSLCPAEFGISDPAEWLRNEPLFLAGPTYPDDIDAEELVRMTLGRRAGAMVAATRIRLETCSLWERNDAEKGRILYNIRDLQSHS